jgi:hypothetical protein
MMMAAGCIQAMRCHTDTCPSGVATQNAWRGRAVDVGDKGERVRRFQEATVGEASRMMASMGAARPEDVLPSMVRMNVSGTASRSYAELYDWLGDGELLAEPPETWAADWAAADPHRFGPRTGRTRS